MDERPLSPLGRAPAIPLGSSPSRAAWTNGARGRPRGGIARAARGVEAWSRGRRGVASALVRSILYRFPDLPPFEAMLAQAGEGELELGLPAGEAVEDGEWVLAILELGAQRRAISSAARGVVDDDGARLVFEPRDWRLIERFAQTDARKPATSGTRPTARYDQGDFFVADETVDERDRPTLLDPVAPPAEPARAAAPAPARPSSPARVLIVDDDPDIREVVETMLEAVGLKVVAASSGEEALERVAAERFDLLVLDWHLPRMSGLDLCRRLRREAALTALPVLFLTANTSQQDMVEAFACGADDYVVKPFRAPELGARIFSLLRRARLAAG
jgi:two-component system phosphate regulon response regulator PhoB